MKTLRLVTALLACTMPCACDDDAVHGGPRRGRGATEPSAVVPVPAPPEGETSPRPHRPRLLDQRALEAQERGPAAPAASQAGGAPGEAAEEAEGRDLEADLRRAFGAPADCLSEETRDAMGDALTLQVSVRVTPAGRVVSAEVTGGALSEADRACLTRRAEGIRMAAPIEDAPRTVSATIRYSVQDGRVTTTERELPERSYGPGTLLPDSTLPAAGTETERPAGSLAPSSTLPAQGAEGRPPGFVPPSSTLPALGE